jgi:hypothetical protein
MTTITVTPGIYMNMALNVYRVKQSQNNHLYAEKLNKATGSWSYEEAKAEGAVFNLKPQHRLPLEWAKAWGLKTGRCLVCGRELSNTKSAALGIGPRCAKMF